MKPIRNRTAEAGIGLIELMIALSLGTILLAVVYNSYFRTQRAAQGVMGKVESRQGARGAMQLIERDLRMAGSGWGRMQVDGVFSNTPLALHGLNPGYTSATGQDSVSSLGAWDVSTTLSSTLNTQALVISCASVTGFASGDLVVVTNGASAHLFQVTGISSNQLQHATTSNYNVGTRSNWPVGGYPAGSTSRVFKVGWVTYRYDASSYQKPSIVRQEVGKTPMLVAYDVESFRAWYRMADGTTTRNPVNFPMIEQVVPVLRMTNTSGVAAQADSVWAAIRPRTY